MLVVQQQQPLLLRAVLGFLPAGSVYLQAALNDSGSRFRAYGVIDHLHLAKNITELDLGEAGVRVEEGGHQLIVLHIISKATGDTREKWYQDKELFL